MFVRSDWTRRGLGRAILEAGRDAARAEGFRRLDLGATLPGVPLYRAFGFNEIEPFVLTMPDGKGGPGAESGGAPGRRKYPRSDRADHSGEVVAVNGKVSGQCDILIVDPSTPTFWEEGLSHRPCGMCLRRDRGQVGPRHEPTAASLGTHRASQDATQGCVLSRRARMDAIDVRPPLAIHPDCGNGVRVRRS
jgi:hypothetical protein